jgi:hypothetical protein
MQPDAHSARQRGSPSHSLQVSGLIENTPFTSMTDLVGQIGLQSLHKLQLTASIIIAIAHSRIQAASPLKQPAA